MTTNSHIRQPSLALRPRRPSRYLYPALMLGLNIGVRAEMKNLAWTQIDFVKRYLPLGRRKAETGEGRTIPLSSVLYDALASHAPSAGKKS